MSESYDIGEKFAFAYFVRTTAERLAFKSDHGWGCSTCRFNWQATNKRWYHAQCARCGTEGKVSHPDALYFCSYVCARSA